MIEMTSKPPLVEIQPLPRLALFEALASELEEWILSGRLESGAKLPSEEMLAKRFGVSRPVVREALARLRERGLVDTVNGSGTFVKPPDADHLTDAFLRHLRVGARGSIGKAYEARIAIETTTARLAAERGTKVDRVAIRARLEDMRNDRHDIERWTVADLGFHTAVAAAAHNPFLVTLLAPLVKVIERGIIESFPSPAAVAAGLRAHDLIWERLEARDPDGAERAMREHLIDSERRFASANARSAKGLKQ
jgi:GntR family transcriptional regulator, transcriptional repressor for pyruvate dehydrogenase complex